MVEWLECVSFNGVKIWRSDIGWITEKETGKFYYRIYFIVEDGYISSLESAKIRIEKKAKLFLEQYAASLGYEVVRKNYEEAEGTKL